MPAVVAISDLHLGEESSAVNPLPREVVPPILKKYPEFKNPPINTTPGKLNKLLKGIAVGHGDISELVLVGDILDLSLAPYQTCALQAREFFRQLLDGIQPGALVWVPGNHDHHLWVQVCEEEYIAAPLRRGQIPGDYPRISGPGRGSGALNWRSSGVQFLLGLLPGHVWDRFWMAYPNYVTSCGDQELLFHHGHFFDGKQSWIGTSLFEAQSLSELEVLNSFYLDFIHYGMGQAGRFSEQMENVYEELRWLRERLGMALDFITLKKFFQWLSERAGGDGDRGIRLGGKLSGRIARYLRYVERERDALSGVYPEEFGLVFGHTHRPFAGGVVGKIPVYNTGGWTVDELWPGGENLHTGVFVAVPGQEFQVLKVEIDREVYDFFHKLNNVYREFVKIDPGAPGQNYPKDGFISRTPEKQISGVVSLLAAIWLWQLHNR